MKTKWVLTTLAALMLGVAILSATGCKKTESPSSDKPAVKYTCSMHPEVVQDAPGNCPKCGMKLVEKH